MRTSINLPRTALRALHSGWCSYLPTLPTPIRDAMVGRAGGLDFEHFVLAVRDGRYLAHARIEGDDAVIGLALPVDGRFDMLLFDLPGRDGGVDADWLLTSETLDLDDSITALLTAGSEQ